MKVVEMVDITSKCDMENLVEPSASGYEDLSGDLPRRRSRSSGSFKLSRPLPLPSTFSPSPKRHASGERVGRANTVRSETRNRGKARIVEFRSPGHLLPDREREWDRFAGIDGASSSSSGYLARVLTPPDSVPPKRFEKPAAAIKAPYPLYGEKHGEILFVTEDISMVYALRFSVALHSIGVTWTNNFWVAMSYLHNQSFDSVVVDLSVESVEEKFLLQFIEEYEIQSRGKKILLSNDATSSALTRQLRRRGHRVLKEPRAVEDLVEALDIAKR